MIQIYISLRLSLEKYLRPILLVGGPSTPRSAAEYYPEDVVLRHPHYAQPVNPPNPDLRSGSTRSASQSQGSSSSSVESLASSSSREVSSSFEATFPQDLQVWSDFFKFQISYFFGLDFCNLRRMFGAVELNLLHSEEHDSFDLIIEGP